MSQQLDNWLQIKRCWFAFYAWSSALVIFDTFKSINVRRIYKIELALGSNVFIGNI